MSVYRIGKTVNEKLPPLYIFIGNKERSIIYTIGNIPETTPAPNYVMCEDITGGALKEIASVFDNRITAFEQVIAGDKLIGMSTTWVLSEEDYDEIAVMLQSLEQK